MYTPDQVEAAAKLLRFDDPSSGDCTYAADILDAYAATLKAAQGGVTGAMVSLIHLWRQREDNGEQETEFDKGYQQASDECADALEAALSAQQAPIPMLLFCPKCHTQHIDAPDARTQGWDNPPHRSHLCHACGCVWRPADVPTTGVERIVTRGTADTFDPTAQQQGEAVAWQYRRLDEEEGPSPYWHHMTREQYEMFRDNPRSNCEVRQLFTAPPAQPAELAAEYTRGRSDGWDAAKAAQPAERVPEFGAEDWMRTHAHAARKAMLIAVRHGEVLYPVIDDPAFWRHEINALDKAMLAASPAPSEGGKGVEG